ncbi:neuronal acetylcholine receptor subunit alpha-10-like isoform X2 [Mytilus edulis]
MVGYEKSVRPVVNSSSVLTVTIGLKLNQIVDLDERYQVLTTNVFIDQEWRDEHLMWEPNQYNNVKSLRIPTKQVWLPDTFIYNNADDGSTGFMQGTYILVTYDGTVLWPVPVKLKSSCKVDITYFPFDDQECILRFGSWIYSGKWMDYQSTSNATPIDLTSYVNNSEWDLLSVTLRKNIRRHSCCPDPHPDLTYILHIRRKTFYYIFNIIVPCVMLSILTLLTFWLPPTSGEKITLGLSVFLAFSMFMLLIAEEVPATSEAVPLIGIYLCVVMTMTSLSVIMAVMVINLYNRGIKTKRAPMWLRIFALRWMSKPLFLKHDLYKIASTISLEEEKEGLYLCKKHKIQNQKPSRWKSVSDQNQMMVPSSSSVRFRNRSKSETASNEADVELEETIWLKNDEIHEHPSQLRETEYTTNRSINNNKKESKFIESNTQIKEVAIRPDAEVELNLNAIQCKTRNELVKRKFIVAEWQRIATVVDRVLFWFYFLGTLASYLIILVFVPNSKYSEWSDAIDDVNDIDIEAK